MKSLGELEHRIDLLKREENKMKKNVLNIDGVKINLTNEQIEKLKNDLGIKKNDSPFNLEEDDDYYFINTKSIVINTNYDNLEIDNDRIKVANACKDKSLMEERAKQEKLNRLLWKFAVENNEGDIDWNIYDLKYRIYYDYEDFKYVISYNTFSYVFGAVYFTSKEIAQRAINEVVLPFERGEI